MLIHRNLVRDRSFVVCLTTDRTTFVQPLGTREIAFGIRQPFLRRYACRPSLRHLLAPKPPLELPKQGPGARDLCLCLRPASEHLCAIEPC